MRAAFYGVDVVHVGVDVLRVVGVVHHCHFNGHSLLLCLQVYHVVEKVGAVAVNVAHKLLQSVLGMEHLLACLSLLVGAHVGECYGYSGIEVCQLTHTLRNDVVFVCRGGEHCRVWPELLSRTA